MVEIERKESNLGNKLEPNIVDSDIIQVDDNCSIPIIGSVNVSIEKQSKADS